MTPLTRILAGLCVLAPYRSWIGHDDEELLVRLPPDIVLSQNEQTLLGLAGWFFEDEDDGTPSPIWRIGLVREEP